MSDEDIIRRLVRIERKVDKLIIGEMIIMADLTTLENQVKANTDAEDSAVILLNGLAAQLAAAATDPAKVQALASNLKASADKLAAAVVANTPASPTP